LVAIFFFFFFFLFLVFWKNIVVVLALFCHFGAKNPKIISQNRNEKWAGPVQFSKILLFFATFFRSKKKKKKFFSVRFFFSCKLLKLTLSLLFSYLIGAEMARILGGGAFGEMRGKLGSMVFARNRGGAYARQYAMPVDPNTIAQQYARGNFGAASSAYHSMSDTLKVQWQQFANLTFNPKTGTVGVPTGFNAFVSLLNVVNNAKLFSEVIWGKPTPITGTQIPFFFSADPPLDALEATILAGTGAARTYSFNTFTDVDFATTGSEMTITGQMKFNITGGIGPVANTNVMKDGKGNSFGFKVFMSNPVNQPSSFVQNPYLIDIGSTGGFALTAPTAIDTELTVDFESVLQTANYSALPNQFDYVRFTVFAVSMTGMLLKLGSKMVQWPS
jgi:hypothetical protein